MEPVAHQRKADRKTQSVTEHLLAVADCASTFASAIHLPLCGQLLGLLHDLGKYSDEFQQYICSAIGLIDPGVAGYVDYTRLKGKIDHSSAGAQFVENVKSSHRAFPYLSQLLSIAIMSHHGGLIDCIAPDGSDRFSRRLQKKDEKNAHKRGD